MLLGFFSASKKKKLRKAFLLFLTNIFIPMFWYPNFKRFLFRYRDPSVQTKMSNLHPKPKFWLQNCFKKVKKDKFYAKIKFTKTIYRICLFHGLNKRFCSKFWMLVSGSGRCKRGDNFCTFVQVCQSYKSHDTVKSKKNNFN